MSDLLVLDVPGDDVLLVEALLVYEGHGEVELLGQDARPPRAALVRRADHRLLPVRNILLDPPDNSILYQKLISKPPPFGEKCKLLSLCPSSDSALSRQDN